MQLYFLVSVTAFLFVLFFCLFIHIIQFFFFRMYHKTFVFFISSCTKSCLNNLKNVQKKVEQTFPGFLTL